MVEKCEFMWIYSNLPLCFCICLSACLSVSIFVGVIYRLHYTISRFHSNKLSNVNMLHECKSCSRSRTSEMSFVSVYRDWSQSMDNICGCVKCSILYKEHGLQYIICACYSWEMSLNVSLDISFDNMWGWNGIQKKAGEVTSSKSCTSDETSLRFLNSSYTSYISK
jgi:hypothetical protein